MKTVIHPTRLRGVLDLKSGDMIVFYRYASDNFPDMLADGQCVFHVDPGTERFDDLVEFVGTVVGSKYQRQFMSHVVQINTAEHGAILFDSTDSVRVLAYGRKETT